MRWFLVAVFAALASGAVHAAEPVAGNLPVPEAAVPAVTVDAAVPVTLPPPAAKLAAAPEIKPAAKAKAAPAKSKLKKSMLSRTARNQLVLAVKPKAESASSLVFSEGDDTDASADDLDLHRSFSRPRVAKAAEGDADDDAAAIPESARLRLFLARMKAVEAHTLIWGAEQKPSADGDDLSDTVKLRLFLARMAAVEAHKKKFA